MKILRTIETFYPYMSGPANQAFRISRELEKKGISSPVFTTNANAPDAAHSEKIDMVDVKRFEVRARFMKFLYTPQMKKAMKDEKPQLIHSHNYRSYQTEAGYGIAKELNLPFVLNVHGSLLGYESITRGTNKIPYKVYDFYGKNTVLKASAVIVSSKQEYDEAVEFGVDKEKLHIIPMGIDVEEYEGKKKRKDDNLRLLFVGRICRDRNLMPILKALKKLNDPKIELRIVGEAVKRSDTEKEGYLDELKEYAKKNNLNVTFTGARYDEELRQEYRDADIFVYTSLWENFGQAILEAGAAGLPVIATPVGVARDIVKNGRTGFLVGFEELDKLHKRIKDIKEKRKKLGAELKKLIQENYQWEDIIMEYEKVYLKLLGKK